MKKTFVTTSIVVVISIIFLIVFIKLTSDKDKEVDFAEVTQGFFEISISGSGELIAENSVDIKGPDIVRNRNFRATPLKIIDLVPEGTVVRKGDYIATLDRSSFNNTLRDEQEILKTAETEFHVKVLDTAVVLSTLRDDIRNQHFTTQEAGITVEQSKFEPPATQRQSEITLEKEQRALAQKKKLYSLKSAQTRAELRTLQLKVSSQRRKVDDLETILNAFIIKAPSDGMVIYKKDRTGVKITTGTTINPWDPAVATLPDLSSLLSKVYISEIEINKIQKGMPAGITIDAFKDKLFRGKVYNIANIGEQLPNSDSKVFEVLIRLDDNDPMLRPSMTTGNKLIVKTFDKVISVPNESVHASVDSIPYVYTKDGTKQVVLLGESNEKNIIIEEGLAPGTKIWLSTPDNPEKFKLVGTELIPRIKEREVADLKPVDPSGSAF